MNSRSKFPLLTFLIYIVSFYIVTSPPALVATQTAVAGKPDSTGDTSQGLLQELIKEYEALTIKDKGLEESDSSLLWDSKLDIVKKLGDLKDPVAYRFLARILSGKERFYGAHGEVSNVIVIKRALLQDPPLALTACLEIYPGENIDHRIRMLDVVERIRQESLPGQLKKDNSFSPHINSQDDFALQTTPGMPPWFKPFVARIVAILDDAIRSRTPQEAYRASLLARRLNEPETLRLLVPLLSRTDKILARYPMARWDIMDRPVYYKFNWVHPLLVYLRPNFIRILNVLELEERVPWRSMSFAVLAGELLSEARFSEAILDILLAIDRSDPQTQIGLLRALKSFDLKELTTIVPSLAAKDSSPYLRGLLLELQAQLKIPIVEQNISAIYEQGDVDLKIYLLETLGDFFWPIGYGILVDALSSDNPFLRQRLFAKFEASV
jgi:hypothetical protein